VSERSEQARAAESGKLSERSEQARAAESGKLSERSEQARATESRSRSINVALISGEHGERSRTPNRPQIAGIAVGVPARDEAERVVACLRSLLTATHSVAVPVSIVVAADSCTDDTADRARSVLSGRSAHHAVVECRYGVAGRTRDLACRSALSLLGRRIPMDQLWVATTDADSTVPPDWLARQLCYAALGVDGVAGLVRLDPAETATTLEERFTATIEELGAGGGHGHVHGANIGIRASTFLAAGGFDHRAIGEDQHLWASAGRVGARLHGSAELTVVTSARLQGRTPGGFARFLAELSAADAAPLGAVGG
jgi:cellulose synthase/poly-beta-1,6-N-acetylglucosamine synthase-like glycosyltransferase